MQLWATSDWQLHHNNVSAHASCLVQSFLVKHQITQVTQSSYSSHLVPCDFWPFPKLKSPLKGKRFQTADEIQKNITGQQMVIGKERVKLKGAYFEEDCSVIALCTMFLYLVSSIHVSTFHIVWLDTFWTDLLICRIVCINIYAMYYEID